MTTGPDPYAGFQGGTAGPTAAIADPAQDIYNRMSDVDRQTLAAQLNAAGYKVPTSGKKSTATKLADAYLLAEAARVAYNQRLGLNLTLRQYLAEVPNENLTGTGGKGYVPRATITSPTQAAADINAVLKDLGFQREASSAELAALTKELNKAERKTPKTRTTTSAGTYEYSGGIDVRQKIKDLITSPSATVKKLPLVKELVDLTKTAEIAAKQKLDTATQALLATAKANGLNLTQNQIDNYKARLSAGETIEGLKQDVRKIASLGMPDAVKSLIGAGSDLEDVYSPYRQVMASTLEIPFDQININDPVLRGAISPTGEMPIYDFQRTLRKDPRWQYTNNAREEASNAVTQILKDFGFRG